MYHPGNRSQVSGNVSDQPDRFFVKIANTRLSRFRYAQCQLDSLAKMRDRRLKKVKDALKIMPKDIFSSYQKILTEAQNFDDWTLIERILVLVKFSARPISLAEALEFAVLEEGMTRINSDDRLDLTELDLAAINMLIVVRDGILVLAHKSVQDFFDSCSTSGEIFPLYQNADVFIAGRCLQYLSFPQPPANEIVDARNIKESPNAKLLIQIKGTYPFLDYAASKWPRHLTSKEKQEQVQEMMRNALPLTAKPNLWKAWLMLQRVDIWQTQIELALVVSEAFIRGCLATNWSNNFWKLRQNYRIHRNASDKQENTTLQHRSNARNPGEQGQLKKHFWVKAIIEQKETVSNEYLQFEKDAQILITEVSSETIWQGQITLPDGQVLIGVVRVANVHTVKQFGKIVGSEYLNLAVLLLEIALQKPIFPEMNQRLERVFCRKDLGEVLGYLHSLMKVTRKMGLKFIHVIDYCLSKILWANPLDSVIGRSDDLLVDGVQDTAMRNIYDPLCTILASGFRATREPDNVSLPVQGRRPQTETSIGGRKSPNTLPTDFAPGRTTFSSEALYSAPSGYTAERATFSINDISSAPNRVSLRGTTQLNLSFRPYTLDESAPLPPSPTGPPLKATSAYDLSSDIAPPPSPPAGPPLKAISAYDLSSDIAPPPSPPAGPPFKATSAYDLSRDIAPVRETYSFAKPPTLDDVKKDLDVIQEQATPSSTQNLSHDHPVLISERPGSIQSENFSVRRLTAVELPTGGLETVVESKSEIDSDSGQPEIVSESPALFPPPSIETNAFTTLLYASKVVDENCLTWTFPDETGI